jgi:ABC-type branched-subunit amino acid transport system ATPase component
VSGIAEVVYLLDSGNITFEGKADELIRDRVMLRTYLG